MPQLTEVTELSANILIVDDDRRLLEAVEESLRRVGGRCKSFSNVDEALSYFSMADVDIIITDLSMPGIDGSGLISLIRANSNIPIVIVTGNTHAGAVLAERHKNVAVFRKPFAPRALITHVEAAVAEFRTTRSVRVT